MEADQNESDVVTTRSIGIRFGVYSAFARLLLFAVAITFNLNAFNGPVSWVSIAIAVALIVLAHMQFKDDGNGFMEYGQGIGISFWMGLAGTVIGVPVMYVYLTFVDSSPFDLMLRMQEDQMIAKGAPAQAIEMGIKWTRNLFWPMAVIGGILMSVIFSLIISIFTKKSNPEMPV